MGSLREDGEYRFFDAQEDISSTSDSNADSIELSEASCSYDIWIRSPGSVKERRSKFLDWMGLSLDPIGHENSVDVCSDAPEEVVDRIRENSGAVLRDVGFEGEFCSSRSSMTWSKDDTDSSQQFSPRENFVCRDGTSGGEVGLGQSVRAEESENTSVSSISFQQLIDKEVEETNNVVGSMKRTKKGWLSRLRSMACVVVDSKVDAGQLRPGDDDAILRSRVQRVKVRQSRKQLKELSALYMGQDIQAHEGAILTMKFSPDGQYLASAGEDGILRLWQVVEDERSNEIDIPEIDPSCIYFTVDHLSELKPLFVDKEKIGKLKSLRNNTSDSACVIFPPKVFRILEKPLHEFHGHSGEILDLSWSKNNVSDYLKANLIL
jgi:WD40 repeat protein